MEGFTYVDAIVAAVVLLSAILAYARGFVREVLAIAGWVIAAVVAFVFAPQVHPLVTEVPVLGDFVGESCELAMITAFAAVFAVTLMIAAFIIPAFSSAVQRSALSAIDKTLGFLFGVLRGVVLVAIAFFIYQTLMPGQPVAEIDESRSAEIFEQMSQKIMEQNPERALGWVTRQYEELVGACQAGEPAEEPQQPREGDGGTEGGAGEGNDA